MGTQLVNLTKNGCVKTIKLKGNFKLGISVFLHKIKYLCESLYIKLPLINR